MSSALESFFSSAQPLIRDIELLAQTYHLTDTVCIDHIGYDCGSRAEFESVRTMFESESEFIYQSIISSRPIAIIKFKTPITTKLGPLFYLELCDQKPTGTQVSGFDHVELAPIHGSYDELIQALRAAQCPIEQKVRPHHTTHDLSVPHGKVRFEPELLITKIKREEMK